MNSKLILSLYPELTTSFCLVYEFLPSLNPATGFDSCNDTVNFVNHKAGILSKCKMRT